MNTSAQNQTLFSFLIILIFSLFITQTLEAQWELLLGAEGENWSIGAIDAAANEDLVFILNMDGQKALSRVNIFGDIVIQRFITDIGLPNEISHTQLQTLKDGGYLLFYQTEEGDFMAKLKDYGKLLWLQKLEYSGSIMETESGDLLQILSVETEIPNSEETNTDVFLTSFNGENGEMLWQKTYGSEADEEISERKLLDDGSVFIAGRSDQFNAFLMEFSAEGDSIGGFTYDFEGDGVEYYWWADNENEYSLEDIVITEENGLIAAMVSSKLDSINDWSFAYLILEKLTSVGDREWRNEYEEDEFDEYSFAFLSEYDINSTLNGNYLIRATWGLEWYRHPFVMEVNSIGEPIYLQIDYDTHYGSYFNEGWYCGVGGIVYDIQEVQQEGYWVTGNSFYEFTSFPESNLVEWGYGFANSADMGDSGYCNYIPFLAKMGNSGYWTWRNFYDLGNPNKYYFFEPSKIYPQSQSCYAISTTVDVETNNSLAYIIHTDNEGNSNSNLVSGRIFLDSNDNCQYDETEKSPYQDLILYFDSPLFQYQTTADFNGNFSTVLPIGDYTLSYSIDNELFTSSCNTNSYQISFTKNYDTLSNVNFALKPLVDCPKLEVEIGTPLLRRCFKNTYKVSYCNKGTLAAEDAKVTLEFPDEMIPLSSSIEALQEGQQWTFDLGTVEIGECGFFTVVDSISCEADLGSTICLKSRILPDDPCEAPSPLWDGSDIEVKGECFGELVRFVLENIGDGDMSEERNLYIYENDLLSETKTFQLKSGETQQLYPNPNGRTLRLKVEQSPYFPHSNDNTQSIVEACGEGNFSYGYVNSVEQNDRLPSIDIDCQTIIGSFDPNDIQVFPTGISDQHYIEESTKLTYKIRFQNTGNDTAFRVMIVDTLPQGLEGATLNLGNSSHDYTFDIKFGNLLVWTFDNILLPDSTTNEPESHGFVQYSIQLKEGLELGTRIENKADIYFDFNEPVATNQVFNTLTDDLNAGLGEPLAVDLMDLEAKAMEGNRVQLDWWTLMEMNSSYFEVERSRGGIAFEAIEKVESRGNSEGLQHYQLTDFNIERENLLYYRLKMVDIDGSFDYSKVVSVRLTGEKLQYRVMDFNGRQILLDWVGEKDEVYTIAVYNTFGQRVFRYKVNELHTVLPELEFGVYVLQILDEQGRRRVSRKVFVN